jgi:hypothetical protein
VANGKIEDVPVVAIKVAGLLGSVGSQAISLFCDLCRQNLKFQCVSKIPLFGNYSNGCHPNADHAPGWHLFTYQWLIARQSIATRFSSRYVLRPFSR